MEELCRRFDETINLAVIDSSRVAYLAMVESSQSVRFAARPGHSDFVHSSALGKSLASRLRVDEVKRMVAIEGMPRIGPNTITVLCRNSLPSWRASGARAMPSTTSKTTTSADAWPWSCRGG